MSLGLAGGHMLLGPATGGAQPSVVRCGDQGRDNMSHWPATRDARPPCHPE